MQFFWISSFTATDPATTAAPRAKSRAIVTNSLEEVPAEGSVIILEIGCDAGFGTSRGSARSGPSLHSRLDLRSAGKRRLIGGVD